MQSDCPRSSEFVFSLKSLSIFFFFTLNLEIWNNSPTNFEKVKELKGEVFEIYRE